MNLYLQELLEKLNLKLIKELEGKNKKVFLVQKDNINYILKIATSDIQKSFIDKEILFNKLVGSSLSVAPKIIEAGSINKTKYLLEEYFILSNLANNLDTQNIKVIYKNLGEVLIDLSSITSTFAGEINGQIKFKSWKEYLLNRLEEYKIGIYENIPGMVHEDIFIYMATRINTLDEPQKFSLLHMDLHAGNIFVTDSNQVKFIDFDEAIYGDKDYEVARILKAHFNSDSTKALQKDFLNNLGLDAYLSSPKAKLYSDIRTLHYIEILTREGNREEIENQLKQIK